MKLPGTAISLFCLCLSSCKSAPIDSFPSLQDAAKPLLANICPTGAEVSAELIPNPHVPDLVDRIETKTCTGISVKTYISTAASDPGGLTMSLEITKPNHLLPYYMDVGQPIGPLLAKLGMPSSRTGSDIVYSVAENEDSVTFSVAGGHVVAVRWDWPVD